MERGDRITSILLGATKKFEAEAKFATFIF
jgi:hypothetical protein